MKEIDEQVLFRILKNCFLKVKTFLCYDKTLLHLKYRTVELENDPSFNSIISELAHNLKNENWTFFEKFIEDIDFVVRPKKFSEPETEDHYAKLSIGKSSKVTDINFFINCDIRLLVLDMLYMLLIKKISNSHISFKHSYAGRFKKSLFAGNDNSLMSGIDFKSGRCFVNYYDSYKKWRDTAFKKVEDYSKLNKTNCILFSLDIDSFYYNIEFSFSNLHDKLQNDDRLHQISFIERIIEGTYQKYFSKIKAYFNFGKRKDGTLPFPIGLFSPIVLRDIYLNNLDNAFSSIPNVLYYGRYVDDILLLVPEERDKGTSDELITSHLVETNILHKYGKTNKNYYFDGYENLKTSFDKKDRYFFFEKGKEPILIKAFKEVLNRTTSEESLLPDMEFIDGEFDKKVYGLIFNDASRALRNLNLIISDISSATHYMKSMIKLYKGTSFASRKATINNYISKINAFFDGCLAIQYSQSWTLLFESLVVLGPSYSKEANSLYSKIKNIILQPDFYVDLSKDKYNQRHYKQLIRRTSASLKDFLNISLCTAFCLNPSQCRIKSLKSTILSFRHSNMFDQTIATVRLIGYLNGIDDEMSLIEPSFSYYLNKIKDFEFDKAKIDMSPSFFHYNDLAIIGILQSIKHGQEVEQSTINDYYSKFNNIDKNTIVDFVAPKKKDTEIIRIYNLDKIETLSDPLSIALPNVSYSENDIADTLFNKYSSFSLEKKIEIINVLLESHRKKANFIIFPELYFPIEWIYDILSFAKAYQISLVFGCSYVISGTKAHNFVASLIAFKYGSFKFVFPTIREKIHYPPHEKQILASAGYHANNINPTLDIFKTKDYGLSNLLCFELTDIELRHILKGKIQLLIVPELNPDTNYFSSLIESSARDLYCFVIQENSAIYGDCRITGPYDTLRKNIIQFKGGKNSFVVTYEMSFKTFTNQQKELENRLNNQLIECFACKKVKKKMSKAKRKELCKRCKAKRKYTIEITYSNDPTGYIKPKPPNI